MSSVRRWAIPLAGLACAGVAILAGCSSNDNGGGDAASTSPDSTTSASTAPVDPDRYVVWVDNNAPAGFPATYEYFFPDRLRVPQGATVDFRMDWNSGEPHNVALGTVVDGAREAIDALPESEVTLSPGAPLPVSPELQAQFARMPQALPPDQATTAETMRLAQPCFIAEGLPPLDEPCGPDQRTATEPFDGTQSYVSSQVFIDDGDTFTLDLAEDMAAGDYTFICTLHPTFMYGTLEVVADPEAADTPTEVSDRGQEAIDALNDQYRPIAQDLAAQTGPTVDAGALGDGGNSPEITINVFPNRIDAAPDEPITWNVVGAHMFTFEPPPDRPVDVVLEERDGVVTPVEWTPDEPSSGRAGMPPIDQIVQALTTGTTIEVDDGELGQGEYLHSGLLFGSLGPLPPTTYTLRLRDEGDYTYYCMRHPGMSGTVTVADSG